MEVVVGSYNNVLFGFEVHSSPDTEEVSTEAPSEDSTEWQFKARFTDQGHAGCIKAVSCGNRYLASGSADETIRLFDLRKHIEVGTLVQQSGAITDLAFTHDGHMLSASEDGTICVWKCKTWECEKVLKAHRGAVTSISVHPSGKLALSVSKDKTIRTWNLLSGRCAYTTTLKNVAELVRWSPSGESYCVVSLKTVTIYQISAVQEPLVYESEKNVLACEYLNDTTLVIAGESENVVLFNTSSGDVIQKFQPHDTRTKAMYLHNTEDGKFTILFSVSSDGNLRACRLNRDDLEEKPLVLATITLPCRPTCITVKEPIKENVKEKQKELVTVEIDSVEKEAEVAEELDVAAVKNDSKKKSASSTEQGVKKKKKKKVKSVETS